MTTELSFNPDERETMPCPECDTPMLLDIDSVLVDMETYCSNRECRVRVVGGGLLEPYL